MKLTKKAIILLLAGMMGAGTAQAEDLLAFPGAAGWGRFAKGARASSAPTVYHVTNLNDSGTGSLRAAVTSPNRIVVFDVAGVIKISSRIVFANNIYVAGQTAPGEGITVYGNGCSFSGANNIICRYIRWRMGHGGDNGRDCAGVSNGTNMIFDHCSFSWGLDEVFSINSDGKGTLGNITLMNCIFGQGLMTHSAGGLMQADNITLYRNLYIDNSTRNNKVKGINQYVNNVVYNWKNGCYIMGGDSQGSSYVNIESNLFINGPAKGGSAFGGGNSDFHFYGDDNWQDDNLDGKFNPYLMTATGGADRVSTPYAYPELEKYNGDELLVKNIPSVGASLPYRDQSDCYMIDELMSLGKEGNLISLEANLPIGAPDTWDWYAGNKKTDTDGDGIPDEWEDAHSLNKNLKSDALAKAANGYLNIENYINNITVADRDYFLRAPITLDVTKATSTTLTLTWRDYTYEEQGFAVEVEKDGTWTEVGRTAANATSYQITNLEPAKQYNVRVRAFGMNGTETSYSKYATGTFNTRMVEQGMIDIDSYNADVTLGDAQTVWNNTTTDWKEGKAFADGNNVLLNADDNRTLTIEGNVNPAATVVNGKGNLTINGNMQGAGSLNKSNSGTLTLNSDNAYTGATVNHEGTIEFATIANGGQPCALGAAISDPQSWVFDGGTYKYTGASASTDRSARIITNSTLNIANAATTLTMSGKIEGNGDFTIDGNGTVSIADAKFFSEHTGDVVLKGGRLYLSNSETASKQFSANCNKLTLAGGHLHFATQSSGSEDYQTINLPIKTLENTESQVSLPNHGYFKGSISGAGSVQFNVPYLRSTIESNLSDFTGQFIANGTNKDWSLIYNGGTWNIPSTRIYLKGKARMGAWSTNADNHIGGLSGDATTYLMGSSKKTSNYVCTWTVGSSNSDETFRGTISNMACNGGEFKDARNSIVKVGTGYWRLTGSNTYLGTTTVNAGTLIINGRHSGTGLVTVNNSGTLKGEGTVTAAITVKNGGVIAAGDTIIYGKKFTLNGSVILEAGSTMRLSAVNTEEYAYRQNTYYMGGTLNIKPGAVLEVDMSNVSKALESGNYFIVFSNVPTTTTGEFTISPATPGEGLVWDTSSLFKDGKLYIIREGEERPDNPATVKYTRKTLYSWESAEGKVTETGGVATMKNAPATDANRVNYANTVASTSKTYYTICLNGKYASMTATPSASATYVQIDLKQALEAGDSIWITAYQNKGTTAVASPFIYTGTTQLNDGIGFNDLYDGTLEPNTRSYSLGNGCAGADFIRLSRGTKQGTNLFITKIVVTRWAEDTASAVDGVVADDANTTNGIRYNMLGQPVDDSYHGIVITDGVKAIQ